MIEVIEHKKIKKALASNKRQYLCGDLKIPQDLIALSDSDVEVGITHYKKYGTETAHYHTTCSEYQYIIAGSTKYLNIDTGEVFKMKKGDFFIIRPNTKYYQKAKRGCKILFFKYPGGNDKIATELTKQQQHWGEKYRCSIFKK